MTNTRTKVNIVLLAILPALHEFWQLWKGDLRMVNPWLLLDYPYSIQWVLKDIGEKLSLLDLAIVVFRFSRMNQSLRIAAWVVLLLQIVDVAFYFVNFNKFNYLMIYLPATPITLIVAFFKDELALWGRRKYYHIRRKYIRWKLKWDMWHRNRKFESVPLKTNFQKQETIDA